MSDTASQTNESADATAHRPLFVRTIADTPAATVTMDGAKDCSMRMLVGRDDGAPNFSMRHFTIAPNGHTPHHQHDYEHELIVLRGEGVVMDDDQPRPIRAGDAIYVQPNHRHQFRNTGDEALEVVCLVPGHRQCGDVTPGS